VLPNFRKLLDGTGVAIVFTFRSADEAREEVRKARDEYLTDPDLCFVWGRFVFAGDSAFVRDLRHALP
jgi:hypothetical protein